MQKPALLLAVLCVVALGGVAAVLWLSDEPAPTTAGGPASTATPEPAGRSAVALTAPSVPEEADETSAAAREELTASELAETSWDAAETAWVRGVVVAPPGTPADERFEVFALKADDRWAALHHVDDAVRGSREGPRLRDPLLSRAQVDADGGFRLGFPPDLERGWVAVVGRYASTAHSVEVAPGDAARVELRPRLGAWLRGRVELPSGAPASALDGLKIELSVEHLRNLGLTMVDGGHPKRTIELTGEADFEFRAVPAGAGVFLAALPDGLARFRGKTVDLEPGQRHDAIVALEHGGALSGTVRDEEGQPVAGAEVEALQRGMALFGQRGDRVREVVSGDDGSFELPAVTAGRTSLRATKNGFLEGSRTVVVENGDRQEGLEVVLSRGKRVAGVVQWPDGSPAAEAEVDLEFDLKAIGTMDAMNAMRGAEGEAETGTDGTFAIGGLGGGPFALTATSRPRGAEEDSLEWRARVDGVRPGVEDLVLVLREPIGLRGRVVDVAGEPVTAFRIQAVEKTDAMIPGLGGRSQGHAFEDERGAFLLEGLDPGKWEVFAVAEGFGLPQPTEVVLPQGADAEIVIELERAASVAGRVLDPDGAPVSGAHVGPEISALNVGRMARVLEDRPGARTDGEGRFRLEGLTAGVTSLVAQAEGWAASEPLAVDASAGQEIEDVVLTLRVGGRLTGEVWGEDGERLGGVSIMATIPGSITPNATNADDAGEFVFERLTPGDYQVITMGAGPAEGDPDAGDASDLAEAMKGWKFAFAEVRDGEETHVVLGAPAADPVRASGRVLLDGTPQPGLMVNFVAEGEGGMAALRFDATDDEGRWESVLEGPGRYLVSVQRMGAMGAQQSLEFQVDVPEAETWEHDFELPTGRISGRVLGPDGAPATSARVSVTTEGPVPTGSFLGGHWTEISTDDNGEYTADWLRPGTYSVSAGGSLLGGMFGGDSAVGRRVRQGLRVDAGQWIRGIDFRLGQGCKLSGRVLDASGRPVPEAAVFVRDGEGQLLERLSFLETDGSGRFTYPGVEPGSYTVSARKGALAAPESALLRVTEEAPAEFELRMGEGTELVVQLTDRDGTPLRAAVSVLDEAGRQVNGLLSMTELMEAFREGRLLSNEQRVGPLPPGHYVVTAVAEDGRDATKPVNLDGQEERKLTLRLRD